MLPAPRDLMVRLVPLVPKVRPVLPAPRDLMGRLVPLVRLEPRVSQDLLGLLGHKDLRVIQDLLALVYLQLVLPVRWW